MRFISRLLLYMLIILIGLTAHAQDTLTCTANAPLNFARATAACAATQPDEVCYGSGSASAQTFESTATLRQPGDKASLDMLHEVTTDSSETVWSTALLKMWASLDRSQPRSIVAWLFGDATIVNQSVPSPEFTDVTIGSATLRHLPSEAGVSLAVVPVNTELTVNGRSSDGLWYRVFVPNRNTVAWVSSGMMPMIDFQALAIADPEAGYAAPFKFITLVTGIDDALCDDTPQSGMLLQSPNQPEPAALVINGVTLFLNGTAFLQANPGEIMTINIIDGVATLTTNDELAYLPPGTKAVIQLDEDGLAPEQTITAEPYDPTLVNDVPLTSLPFRVRAIPEALTREQIETITAEFAISQRSPQQADPAPQATLDSVCRYTMAQEDDLRAGPGRFYEVAGGLMRGAQVSPILQTTDAAGRVWYQISSGPWVAAASIISAGTCRDIPTSNSAPPPPNNELIMETCESTNGPLRGGQRVTIQFTPPAWETLGEALVAPRIDPGRILVDGLPQSIFTFDPIRITPTAVARTFGAEWTATIGTHHITGERLSYSLICDLTVTAG